WLCSERIRLFQYIGPSGLQQPITGRGGDLHLPSNRLGAAQQDSERSFICLVDSFLSGSHDVDGMCAGAHIRAGDIWSGTLTLRRFKGSRRRTKAKREVEGPLGVLFRDRDSFSSVLDSSGYWGVRVLGGHGDVLGKGLIAHWLSLLALLPSSKEILGLNPALECLCMEFECYSCPMENRSHPVEGHHYYKTSTFDFCLPYLEHVCVAEHG
ncbi:hypothetical protein CCH79_00014564, partial [Gambusia affinis]